MMMTLLLVMLTLMMMLMVMLVSLMQARLRRPSAASAGRSWRF
jgi:preprotein translocase subunit SecG